MHARLQTCSDMRDLVFGHDPLWRAMIIREFGRCNTLTELNLSAPSRSWWREATEGRSCPRRQLYILLTLHVRHVDSQMEELSSRSFPSFVPGNEAQTGLSLALDFMTSCTASGQLDILQQRMCCDVNTQVLCSLAASSFARLAEGAMAVLANLLCSGIGGHRFSNSVDRASKQGQVFLSQLASLHPPVVRQACRPLLARWSTGGLPALQPLELLRGVEAQSVLKSGEWAMVTYSSKGDAYECAATMCCLLDPDCRHSAQASLATAA